MVTFVLRIPVALSDLEADMIDHTVDQTQIVSHVVFLIGLVLLLPVISVAQKPRTSLVRNTQRAIRNTTYVQGDRKVFQRFIFTIHYFSTFLSI